MSILARYLVSRHLFLLGVCLALGVGLYQLIDTVQRLDEFSSSGQGLDIILVYTLAQTPIMVSRVLPGVFLLALVVQLGLMRRSRELIVLQAGGVSPLRLAMVLLVYGLLWSGVQFAFTDYVANPCRQVAKRIWNEDIRGHDRRVREVRDVWFKRQDTLVHLERALPDERLALGVDIYRLDSQQPGAQAVIHAEQATSDGDHWRLSGVEIYEPGAFSHGLLPEMQLDVGLDLSEFTAISSGQNPRLLSAGEMAGQLVALKASGADTRRLSAMLHAKFAQAGTLVVMVLAGLAIVAVVNNIYLCVLTAMLVVFGMFSLSEVGYTLGSTGVLPPWAGAWLANLLVAPIAALRVASSPNLH